MRAPYITYGVPLVGEREDSVVVSLLFAKDVVFDNWNECNPSDRIQESSSTLW